MDIDWKTIATIILLVPYAVLFTAFFAYETVQVVRVAKSDRAARRDRFVTRRDRRY